MEEFKTIYNIIIITVAAVLTSFFTNYLQGKITSKKLSTLFAVITVSILAVISNYTVEHLIDGSQTFRRWIDKDNFIEGYFYDLTEDSSKTIHSAMLKITYDKGNYLVTGETIDSSGKHTATFKSTNTIYSNRILFFTYESYNQGLFIEQGVDQLQFGLPPNSYTGFYIKYHGDRKLHFVSGTKVNDKDLAEFGNFETVFDKRNFLEKKIKEYNEKRPKTTPHNK
jgi:hypothetical protein